MLTEDSFAAMFRDDISTPRVRRSQQAEQTVDPESIAQFEPWSISELLAADLSYQWDVRGMLIRPTYGVDTGELKTLKSYFGMARMVGLAAGVPVLGRWEVPERRRVLCTAPKVVECHSPAG